MTRLEADLRRCRPPAAPSGARARAPAPRRSRLVGYTNAGKSTLLNRLTDAGVLVENRLFSTLDPRTRRLALPGGETVLRVRHRRVRPQAPPPAGRGVPLDPRGGQGGRPPGPRGGRRRLPSPRRRSTRSAPVLDEIGAGGVPELLVVNKADRRPACRGPHGQRARGRRGRLRPHRRRDRRVAAGHGRPAAGRRPGGASSSSPSTAATCWPPCTARARSSTSPTAKVPPWSTSCSTTAGRARVPGVRRRRDRGPGAGGAGFVAPALPLRPPGVGRRRSPAGHPGGVVDLSVGTPCDPPPDAVVAALATSGTERGYPASVGIAALRQAAARMDAAALRGVDIDPAQVAACVGTKEFVAIDGVVPAAAHPGPRHRPGPGRRLPDLRHGGAAGGLPGGRGPRAGATAASTCRPSPTTTPSGRCACG